jgi:hypothetical protein
MRAAVGVAAGAAAAALTLLPSPPAWANGGVAMAVDVKNSHETLRNEQGGACTWEVSSDVVLVNLTHETLSINGVGYSVSWTSQDASGVQSDVTVVNNSGLVAGASIGPDERRTFSPVVIRATIPCKAQSGDLAVSVTSPQGTGSGDAPFLSDGTPVPPVAVGGLGLAVLGAASMVLVQRRRRSPAAAVS